MLTRQFSYIKGQEFSIFYFFSEIVTWHEGIGKFRFKSSFKGHTVDFKMCYVIIILYRLSVMLYGEGNICHCIILVCLQTNRKQPGGKHVRIVKKRLRIFNKIAFGGQSWANIFRMEKQNIKISHEEGDIRVYGIAVLGFFSCGISVILILTCGIAVSSSSAVCGFSSFWLTVFGEIRFFMVLRYRLFALSFRYNAQNKLSWNLVHKCLR